jgi:hypothetical protein
MAAGAVSLDVMMNLVFGAISGDREARRQLDKLHAETTASGMARGAKDSKKVLESEWGPTFKKLTKAGMRAAGEELQEASTKAARDQMTAMMKIANLERRIQGEKRDAEKKKLIAEKAALQKSIKAEQWAQEKRLKIAEKEAEKILDLRKRRMEEISKDYSEKMKDTGENLANVIQMAFSADNIDAKGLTEGIGKMLGSGLSKGASMMSGVAGGGKAAASLAASATALAGVVAPIAALVGVFSMAYGQTMQMNKALMASSSAADILGGNFDSVSASAGLMNAEYGALNFRLKMLRRMTLDAATEFRMSTDEVTGYVNALNDAGITMREFRGMVDYATNDMQAYRDVTRTAIIASQGLGISASETADFMNKMQRDMGANLTDIQGAFGMIFSEARKAGMSTKDFVSAINGASSGMAMYNFRVEDTVGLFTDLVKVMGEDLAKTQLGLEGTFKGMGAQEKYKTVMLGGQQMRAGVQASAQRQGAAFAEALGRKGVTIGGGVGGAKDFDLAAVAKLTGSEYRAELRKLQEADEQARERGEEGNLARQFQMIRTVSQATRGGTAGIAAATSGLDPLGELTARMTRGGGMLGGKTLQEALDAGGISAMIAEEVTGQSGEQLENIARIQTSMIAEWEALTGKVYGADTAAEFATAMGSGTLQQTDELKAASEKQFTLMEKSAQEQLSETRSMSQTISNKIAGFLENIWLGIEHLTTMLGASRLLFPMGSGGGMEGRMESLRKEEQSAKALEQISAELTKKKGARLTAETPEAKAKLDREIRALEEKAAKEKGAIEVERGARRRLMTGEDQTLSEARRSATREKVEGDFEAQFGAGSLAEGRKLLAGLSPEEAKKRGLIQKGAMESGQTWSMGSAYQAHMLEQTDPKTMKAMEELLAEQVKRQEEDAAINKQLAGDEAQRQEASDKLMEGEFKKVVDTFRKLPQEQAKFATQQMLSGLGDEQAGQLTSRFFGASSAEEKAAASQAIGQALRAKMGPISAGQAAQFQGMGINIRPDVKDFIYRGDGRSGDITPIDKADSFFGAKPGGPIAGGMGSKTVNISINGGDEARVYNVVKRVLRDSGYGDVKRY